jgi:hypothetical protein
MKLIPDAGRNPCRIDAGFHSAAWPGALRKGIEVELS